MISRFCFFLVLPLVGWAIPFQPIQERQFFLPNLTWHRVENLQIVTQRDSVVFKLLEERPSSDLTEDILLDFEERSPVLKNYHIIHENYIPNPFQRRSGTMSAKFFTRNHMMRLHPRSSALFRPGAITGSFTIEFWAYFHQMYDGQQVVEFIGNNLGEELDENNYGFRIVVRNNRLTYVFENFFWDGEESYSLEITQDNPIRLNQWEHHAVSFNILNGRLTTWRGGTEQQTIWATRNRRPRSTLLIPKMREGVHAVLTLGHGGFFSMDNFAILSVFKDRYAIGNYKQRPAEAVSTVQKMPFLFEMKALELNARLPLEPSHVKIAYRLSNQPFSPANTSLPWVYLPARAEAFPTNMTIGQYIQFKIQYFPYKNNEESPRFSSLSLRYTEFQRPVTPLLLSSEAGNERITLSWLPSPEENIIGYEIYYGYQSQEYLGTGSTQGRSPIFFPHRHQGRLQPISFVVEGLNNNRAYFISIRAVDKWGQRSDFSQEVVLFPSDVNARQRYSVR